MSDDEGGDAVVGTSGGDGQQQHGRQIITVA